MPHHPSEEPKEIFLANLAVIDRIIAAIARRQGLSDDQAEDFASWVKAKLIENDYALIRKFEGRSPISVFLTGVIANLSRDYSALQWGRWRQSSAAKKLGPVAVRLETLLYRDGYTLDEAIEVLRSAGVTGMSDREISELAARLPERKQTKDAGREWLDVVVPPQWTDSSLSSSEQAENLEAVRITLQRAIAELPPEDQHILRLRYWEGLSVAEIARMLHLDQKSLYRRIDKQLRRLRKNLEAVGVEREIVLTEIAPTLSLGGQDVEPPLISIVADLDAVTPELVTELMAALDELHRAHGGGGLRILGAYTGSAVAEGAPV